MATQRKTSKTNKYHKKKRYSKSVQFINVKFEKQYQKMIHFLLIIHMSAKWFSKIRKFSFQIVLWCECRYSNDNVSVKTHKVCTFAWNFVEKRVIYVLLSCNLIRKELQKFKGILKS